jgi:transketolase
MDKRSKMTEEIEQLQDQFAYWEKTKDLVDQLIDIILNYRQSGHPGGSRSKAHILLSLLLSGVMRWDIRQPEKRFADRFILSAGHTVPLVYCTLAVLNEALRIKYQQTNDKQYLIQHEKKRALFWEDLLNFRHRNGLSGHAEVVDKSLLLKFNTGPSGHGGPAAAGQALALKRAGVGHVRVFFLEGEAGLTPGAAHETMNSAWGLNLDNLVLLIDWNDYGIDSHRVSEVVYGKPNDWLKSHGWEVKGTEQGSDWLSVTKTLLEVGELEGNGNPKAAWFKTRKGRGYKKYDNLSHGSPHQMNSKIFWETKQTFVEKYGAEFKNMGGAAPEDEKALQEEFRANLKAVIEILHKDQDLVNYLSNRLVSIGDSVPKSLETYRLGDGKKTPFQDQRVYDYKNYPSELYVEPGTKIANRAALAKWGAWVNTLGAKEYGRPLFIAASADLAGSTNISGFADGLHGFAGYGWYGLNGSKMGTLLPQEITEFANSGIMAGLVTTNLSEKPDENFEGFWGACSTYGSFSYLKYGMMRLFSQMAQDSPLKVGKILWVAGHSGPETADDSRTHFGIFAPGVTQLFPRGSVINLHPWEYNEVPVMLGEALSLDIPLIALHLTRPAITIPDRESLGMPSHFASAKGAYILRDYFKDKPKMGTVIVQGTSAVANLVKLLDEIDKRNYNIKIVCTTSVELFNRQSRDYQEQVLSTFDRKNAMLITTQSRGQMQDWNIYPDQERFALSADWDDRWRTGGTLEEVLEEAHLSPEWILKGISKFIKERES